jgi:Ca2+/Na+ antiporter
MNILNICIPAVIVLIISIVNILANIYIFGLHNSLIVDIIIAILVTLLTIWFCSKNWMTLSWLIAIILTLLTFLGLYLYRIKEPSVMKDIEEIKKQKDKKK